MLPKKEVTADDQLTKQLFTSTEAEPSPQRAAGQTRTTLPRASNSQTVPDPKDVGSGERAA